MIQTQTAATDDLSPAAAEVDPGIRDALPPVVIGERPQVKQEHEWPGNLFVILSYIAAVCIAASAVGGLGWGLYTGAWPLLGLAVGGGLWAAVQWRLAEEVSHFSHWGWYGAMAELGAAALAKVWAMAEGNVVGGLIGLVIDLLWMQYFWDRRAQFDVDLDP